MHYKRALLLIAVVPFLLFGVFSLVYTWKASMARSEAEYEQVLLQATRHQGRRLENIFTTASDGLQNGLSMLGQDIDFEILDDLDQDEIDAYLTGVIGRDPTIHASCVAFVDNWNNLGGKRLFRLAWKNVDAGSARQPFRFIDLTETAFESESWFVTARDSRQGVWNEPYYYKEFDSWIITYMHPIYVGNRFVGELGVCWRADALNADLNERVGILGEGAYSVVINSRGDYLMHPDFSHVRSKINMFENNADLGDGSGWKELETLQKKREIGFSKVKTVHGGDTWLHTFLAPLRTNDWSLAIFLPESNFLLPIHRQLMVQAGIMLAIMLVVMFVMYYGIREFTKPLTDILNASYEYREANIQRKVRTDYRFIEFNTLGTAFNAMIDTIRQRTDGMERSIIKLDRILREVGRMSGELIQTSDRLNQSSLQMSSGAVEQESVFRQISSSIHQLKEHAESNAKLASETNEKIAQVEQMACEGNGEMADLQQEMMNIQDRSAAIHSALKAIDSIAFQTNILALNAAVEAARAGAHGRGFSVVATEVRELANRSARSVTDTARIVNASSETIATGVDLGRKTAASFDTITGIATDAVDMMKKVSEQAGNQKVIVSEVLSGIEEVAHIAKRNVDNASSHAAMAEELTTLAHNVNELLMETSRSGMPLVEPVMGGQKNLPLPRQLNEEELWDAATHTDKQLEWPE